MKVSDLKKIIIPQQEIVIFNQYECGEMKKAYYIGEYMEIPKKLKKAKVDYITALNQEQLAISINEGETMSKEKLYKAEYEADEMEVFSAFNDDEAIKIAEEHQKEKGQLYNLDELNGEYEEIRSIL